MGGRSSKQINPIGQDEDIKIVNSSAPTSGLCPTSIESQKDLEKLEEVNEQGDPKTPERVLIKFIFHQKVRPLWAVHRL